MLSKKIRDSVVKIDALFEYYDDLSKRKINDNNDLKNVKEKMFFARKSIIELTADIKDNINQFEKEL